MWPEVKQALEERRYELVLSGQDVNSLIEEAGGQLEEAVYELSLLNLLRVTNSPLTSLSEDLARLKNLTNLILQKNKLTALPDAVCSLEKLKFLDVSINNLTTLPLNFSRLTSLTTLNVIGNQLTSLPSLQGCVNLSVLEVSENQLSEFPDICHADLAHLSEVRLANNEIPEVPDALTVLPALKLLDVAHNSIKTVPGELCDCVKLKGQGMVGIV